MESQRGSYPALTHASVPQLSRWLREGQCTALEMVEAHITRLSDRANLNAVVFSRFEEAREEARRADRRREAGGFLPPLHGIPITLKECLDLSGTPSTFGIPGRRTHCARLDDPVVARLRGAGAIILGKTNVAQCLVYTEADNPVYGRTVHPQSPERTPGGSSGGEGAAIAVGGSAFGLATDIGGSSRIPAHFCGLVGFKPTTGLLPDRGRAGVPIGQRAIPSSLGIMARDVDSLIAGLQVAVGERDTPQLFHHQEAHSTGFFTNDGLFPPAPAVKRAVEEAALCCNAEPWEPLDTDLALRLYHQILSADGCRIIRDRLASDPVNSNLKPLLRFAGQPTWVNGMLGKSLRFLGQSGLAEFVTYFGSRDTASYWKRVETLLDLRSRYEMKMPSVVLCPPYPLPAIKHGSSGLLATGGIYAPLANLLGCPAGVVPWTLVGSSEESERTLSPDLVALKARFNERGSAGLPVGVQVIGRPGCDSQVLLTMKRLETYRKEHSDHYFPCG